MGRAAVFTASLGGIGMLPIAPGTWGSLIALAIGLWLVPHFDPRVWLVVLGISLAGAIPVCSAAERALARTDPSAVVLDEAWGMLAILAVLPWLVASWVWWLSAFLLFRVFDIVKLPPARQLERLPGGWGIMADDVAAAAQTVLVLWLIRQVVP